MIHRRRDVPNLDPKKLGLPRRPRVLELHAERYTGTDDRESLTVFVVVDGLSSEQRADFTWTIPIQSAILRELDRLGDERFPVLFIREKAEWKGRE